MNNKFEVYLNNFSENDWFSALKNLLPAIHEVDRSAVQIWFRFYPLELVRTLSGTENKDE